MMGSRFFEHTMPRLVTQVGRLADQLEQLQPHLLKLVNPLVQVLEPMGYDPDEGRRVAHHNAVVRERDAYAKEASEAQEEARALRTQLVEAQAKIARLEDPRAQP